MKRQFFLAVLAVALVHASALAQSTQGGSDAPGQPPAERQLRVRVSEKVSQRLLIKRVQPQYPEFALAERIQGEVVLKALIGKDGEVKELTLVSGSPVLAPAALKAVKQWKYKPYLLNGEPVNVETQITVAFQLFTH